MLITAVRLRRQFGIDSKTSSLKNVRMLALLDFSEAEALPFLFVVTSGVAETVPFSGFGFSALGVKDWLMSSMGRRLMGHTSPSATFLAKEGSM